MVWQFSVFVVIFVVCVLDDCYVDDVYYMGGVFLNENFIWGLGLFMFVVLLFDL